jgi:uncharacterized repeat protein (TIGR01451 family)
LVSLRLTDTDNDMTGAMIWATARSSGATGTPVNIAAAWGQDSIKSFSGDSDAMDLGTTVLPFQTIKVGHFVTLVDMDNNAVCTRNDKLRYTIRVQNLGPVDIAVGQIKITDALPTLTNYALNSVWYYPGDGAAAIKINDDTTGTPFPLDILKKRGGSHDIVFEAFANSTSFTQNATITNGGNVTYGGAIPFTASTACGITGVPVTVMSVAPPSPCVPLVGRRQLRQLQRDQAEEERRLAAVSDASDE